MLKINLAVDPEVLEALKHLTRDITASMKGELVVKTETQHHNDEEFEALWNESLIEQLDNDCNHLLLFLEDNRGGKGLTIPKSSVDAVLRGATAVRIKIQQNLLKGIPEVDLENGTVRMDLLPAKKQQAYLLFVFLATLQELIIQQIAPEIF
jgi:hypothetical protein